jgi:hypothetical protein
MIMELDELKSQLKHKLATEHAGRSDEDIAQLLQKRTLSTVGKLKRSLLFEIKLGVPSVALFICIGLFSGNPVLRIYFLTFAAVIAVTTAILIHLYKKTIRLSEGMLPVKENLQVIVKVIDEFVKRCFQMAVWMVPVAVIFMVSLQYYYDSTSILTGGGGKNIYLTTPIRLGIAGAVFTAAVMAFTYYFAKWYLHKMYGKYSDQLKGCIAELEE